MEHINPSRLKEQELEECIQNLLHHLIILLPCPQKLLQNLNQVRIRYHLRDFLCSADGCNKHDAFQKYIVFRIFICKSLGQKVDEVGFDDNLFPSIRVDVDQCTHYFQHHIGVLTALLNHNSEVAQIGLEAFLAIGVELSYISDAFKQQRVSVLFGPCNKLVQLAISCEHVSISLIGRKVNGKCDKFFTNYWFWAMNYQLVHKWDAVSICKSSLWFIFQAHMIEKFNDLCSESWGF